MVQSGLFIKWRQVEWAGQLSNIKIPIKQEDGSIENHLTLNQVSTAFYIILCLPLSIVTLLFEIFCFFFKSKKFDSNYSSKA